MRNNQDGRLQPRFGFELEFRHGKEFPTFNYLIDK